jgi:hypothetical protein
MDLYFSEYFEVPPSVLEGHGAFDISVVSDLPLFIDPFLLFSSEDATYQKLHQDILRYLRFLRDEAAPGSLDPHLIRSWYAFPEVKQNWLGFTLFGNGGQGLGEEFAIALYDALGDIFTDFGSEKVTKGSHLEKLCLIKQGVGRDNISDFTTNLIKGYLLEYTEKIAKAHIPSEKRERFSVPRAVFDYERKDWATRKFELPSLEGDFVLLTPSDLLTRDETWINHSDMVSKFYLLPEAVPDQQIRAKVDRYFKEQLGRSPREKERREAAEKTIQKFPELIDYYIRLQEDDTEGAQAVSSERTDDLRRVLVDRIKLAVHALEGTEFYNQPWRSYDECLSRVKFFKSYIEDNDGYKLLNRAGKPFTTEVEVHIAFGLVWCRTEFDINREPNNGRGPVDFKASFGAGDASLIEFKLGSNPQLKRNLEKQVPIYEKANRTNKSIKVIVYYTARDERRVYKILKELKFENEESIVLIDARSDNKPSASKA